MKTGKERLITDGFIALVAETGLHTENRTIARIAAQK